MLTFSSSRGRIFKSFLVSSALEARVMSSENRLTRLTQWQSLRNVLEMQISQTNVNEEIYTSCSSRLISNGSKNFKNTFFSRRCCESSSIWALTDWERLHQSTSTISLSVALIVSLNEESLERWRWINYSQHKIICKRWDSRKREADDRNNQSRKNFFFWQIEICAN